MSCQNKTEIPQTHTQTAGGSGYPIPPRPKGLPEDLIGVAGLFCRYPSQDALEAAFVDALTPAYQTYKTAVSQYKKGKIEKDAFDTARDAYARAIYQFFGVSDPDRLSQRVSYTKAFWSIIPDMIPDASEVRFRNRRAVPPQRIFTACLYQLFAESNVLADAQYNPEGLREGIEAHHRTSAAMWERTRGIPLPDDLRLLSESLWQYPSLEAFKHGVQAALEPSYERYVQSGKKFRTNQSHVQRGYTHGARENFIADLREAFGYRIRPPVDSPAENIWYQCERVVADLTEKERSLERTSTVRRWNRARPLSEMIDDVLLNIPDSWKQLLFQVDDTQQPVELADPSQNLHALTVQALDAGMDVPTDILIQFPDLIETYGL